MVMAQSGEMIFMALGYGEMAQNTQLVWLVQRDAFVLKMRPCVVQTYLAIMRLTGR